MEAMVQQAIALGLNEVCFTDHIDYGVKTDDGPKERRNCVRETFFEEIDRMRHMYGDRIVIRAGMEFGIQTHTIPAYQRIFDAWPFDFIILSNHQVDDKEFWNQAFQTGKSEDEFQRRYYEAIDEVTQRYHDYCVLGHLDMIKRYDKLGNYPDEKILDIAERILRRVISEGKGIEVNTSSFRYRLEDLTPSHRILELYRDLGGRILTLGSDAHKVEYLADHIEAVRPTLRRIGFKEFCTFERMQPIFHVL